MQRIDLSVLGLAALMAATRWHHFVLPDASLAVFFLAGLGIASPWALALFLAEAGLIDYLAIAYGGVSGWCVTPAYPFLIPTYGALWLGGRLCRRQTLDKITSVAAIFGTLSGSALIAFLISNLSFYALSGYFDDLDLRTYMARILPYLGPYLVTPLAYTASILAARWSLRQLGSSLLHRAA